MKPTPLTTAHDPHRVLVTGLGLITPLGPDRETSWRRLLDGDRAVRRLSRHPDGRLLAPEDAPPPHLAGGAGVDRALARAADDGGTAWFGAPAIVSGRPLSPEPVVDLALRAAREAATAARLDDLDPLRVGCVVGTSKGGLFTVRRLLRERDATEDPSDWGLVPPDAAARAIAVEFGTGGPLLCPVAACATGLAAIVRGAELVREGTCDAVLAGSSDASLLDLVVASFRRLGVHAKADPADPASACRPFDRSRNGFVIGEGAAILVLESATSARRRGARPCAEWLGGRTLGDSTGLTRVDETGRTLSRAIDDTLAATGVPTDAIDLALLHGTGTRSNDVCEARGLQRSLGDALAHTPCCGVKGAIGHLLGAAGSVETAFAALALRDGILPPTANFATPDPDHRLDLGPRARRAPVQHVLKTSLGFGGHVAVGLLRRVEDDGSPHRD